MFISDYNWQFNYNLQIKEGAEKLREVAKDRRALSDVASIVKKSNNKLAELKSELHELESQIILTQANTNGKGKIENFLNNFLTREVMFRVDIHCDKKQPSKKDCIYKKKRVTISNTWRNFLFLLLSILT